MAQTDYLLRMIEQMGQMLAALRGIILGKSASAQVIADRLASAATQGGFDLTLARVASLETIEMMVAPTGDLDPGRCWLVAEILYLDGLQAELEERHEEAEERYRKSLPLYTLLKPKGIFMGLPEAGKRINEIEARIATLARANGSAQEETRGD